MTTPDFARVAAGGDRGAGAHRTVGDLEAASDVWREDALVADRYVLDRPLSGSVTLPVWRAFDRRLRRPVEIRGVDVTAAADPHAVRRVQERLSVLSRIEHDALVRIFDAIVDDGWLLAISEAHGSVPACQILAETAADWRTALATAQPALSALAALHDAGLLHRRVGCHAVLLTEGGIKLSATDHVRHLLSESGLTSGEALSTDSFAYLAPEVAGGDPASVAADVYAAGVVVWELVAGRPAAHCVDRPAWEAPLPALSDDRHGVPDQVDRLVWRATASDPSGRFRDAGELVAAVDQLLPARPEQLVQALTRSLLVAMDAPDASPPDDEHAPGDEHGS